MPRVYRYEEVEQVITHLDPLQDTISWIRRLRSQGFSEQLLVEKHKFSDAKQIRAAANSIRIYVDNATSLIDQAYSSDIKTSYLPMYYAMACLAKICIVATGHLERLADEKRHGLFWSGNKHSSRDLLNDHIELRDRGVFPLYYKALTGSLWRPTRRAGKHPLWQRIPMRDIYPYVPAVTYEYESTYRSKSMLHLMRADIAEDNTISIRIVGANEELVANKNLYPVLKGSVYQGSGTFIIRGATPEESKSKLRRYLMYDFTPDNGPKLGYSLTPRCSSKFPLPAEVATYLAFLHLSNVVRYDPERLVRYFDSPAVALLEALARHGVFTYLLAFWSFITKTSTFIDHY